jgi:hypothetical protein
MLFGSSFFNSSCTISRSILELLTKRMVWKIGQALELIETKTRSTSYLIMLIIKRLVWFSLKLAIVKQPLNTCFI